MTSYSERLAWRAIDANLNRAGEGLRAVEEFARFGENDLGAVGSPGAPSVAGWCGVVAFDAVAVVDLRVVAFAEQS